MDGKEFWIKIDMLLSAKNMTLVALSKETGIPLSTIYRQRERQQLPKLKDFSKIENLLDVWLNNTSGDSFKFSEHEQKVIEKYREMDEAVRDAIDRMLGIEKKSGKSSSRVG